MPDQIFLALLFFALVWRADRLELLLGARFLELLCPHEFRQLRFTDSLTPTRMLSGQSVLFVTVQAPKPCRIGAKRAYARIDKVGIVDFVDAFVPERPPDLRAVLRYLP